MPNPTPPRIPTPRRVPTTLAELVLDLDARSPGDENATLELPPEEWKVLLDRARLEVVSPLDVEPLPALIDVDARVQAARDEEELALRRKLAEAVNFGALNSFDDLLQVARGYLMAHELELSRAAELAGGSVAPKRAALDAFAELGELRELIEGCRKETACGSAASLPEVLSALIGSWRSLCARNVDGSAYTFSKIPPTVEAFLGQNDGKGTDPSGRECHVRFLLDGGRGCIIDFQQAREVAHEVLRKVDEALFPPAKLTKTKSSKPKARAKVKCGHCGEPHDAKECGLAPRAEPGAAKKSEAKPKRNRGRDPDAEIVHRMGGGRQVGDPPELSAVETGQIAASGRRLNGAGWKRGAAKARAENSTSTCHHCGEDDEEAIFTTVSTAGDRPMGTFCSGCVLRLQMNPKEWERHSPKPSTKEPAQIELTEAIAEKTAETQARRPPGRPTKKFPNGGKDLKERCTKCGRTFGSHAGTSCPKEAHGEHPDDFDSEGKLIGTGAAA